RAGIRVAAGRAGDVDAFLRHAVGPVAVVVREERIDRIGLPLLRAGVLAAAGAGEVVDVDVPLVRRAAGRARRRDACSGPRVSDPPPMAQPLHTESVPRTKSPNARPYEQPRMIPHSRRPGRRPGTPTRLAQSTVRSYVAHGILGWGCKGDASPSAAPFSPSSA